MNNERRTAPYAPRVRRPYKPAKWMDVAGAFAIGLAAAYVLSIAVQAIQ